MNTDNSTLRLLRKLDIFVRVRSPFFKNPIEEKKSCSVIGVNGKQEKKTSYEHGSAGAPTSPTQPPAAASAIQESLALTRARVFKLLTQ
jgi:hypothetical protein